MKSYKPWFAINERGHGSNLPFSGEGWMILIFYTTAVMRAAVQLHPVDACLLIGILTLVFIRIRKSTSDPDWQSKKAR
jgi:hypothetical protein